MQFVCVENAYVRALTSALDLNIAMLGRHTVLNKVMLLEEEMFLKMNSALAQCPGRVALTADVWYTAIYEGYMVVTDHWLDN